MNDESGRVSRSSFCARFDPAAAKVMSRTVVPPPLSMISTSFRHQDLFGFRYSSKARRAVSFAYANTIQFFPCVSANAITSPWPGAAEKPIAVRLQCHNNSEVPRRDVLGCTPLRVQMSRWATAHLVGRCFRCSALSGKPLLSACPTRPSMTSNTPAIERRGAPSTLTASTFCRPTATFCKRININGLACIASVGVPPLFTLIKFNVVSFLWPIDIAPDPDSKYDTSRI
ncbi:hypothetical protein C8Q76DRAFT_34740 [Earliella scabrosa]|nr:hypothetical protein C8Q76DRAFT_34740 [Earliella scabrosa]